MRVNGEIFECESIRVFSSLFSPSLFILLHSVKSLVGGGVVGSTPSLAINIDSYVHACITCIHPRGMLLSRGLVRTLGRFGP